MSKHTSNPLIPLSEPSFMGNELKYVTECVESTWISTAGPFIERFETTCAGRLDVSNAIACVNGTAALHMSLSLCGVKPGDEVIVPTLTFIAPVNTIHYVGANPVFMDCDDYMNMDMVKLERFLTEECDFDGVELTNRQSGRRVTCVIPVHVFGAMCDMNKLMEISKTYNLTIVEDATEALGSRIAQGPQSGRFAGTIGDVGCLSFNGNKIITCGGGGMIVSNDGDLMTRAKYLVNQAKDSSEYYVHDEVGYNYRLTALQAAIGLAQIERLDEIIAIKKKWFRRYQEAFNAIEGLEILESPSYCDSNHWFFTMLINSERYGADRDHVMRFLKSLNIQSRPVWKLNHTQKPYRNNQSYKIENAQWFYERTLNLPCSATLSENQFQRVIDALSQCV